MLIPITLLTCAHMSAERLDALGYSLVNFEDEANVAGDARPLNNAPLV